MAETDEWDATAELPPLPPLPDGGLSVSMPAWLRATPDDPEPLAPPSVATPVPDVEPVADMAADALPAEIAGAEATADPHETPPEDAAPAEPPLGPHADPRTFLRDDDFPRWIRELPVLPPRRALPVTVMAPQATVPATPATSPETPVLPPSPLPEPVPLAPAVTAQNPLAAAEAAARAPAPAPVTAPTPTTRGTQRQREPWETPLLVALVVGVILAVIWALLANGLIGNVL